MSPQEYSFSPPVLQFSCQFSIAYCLYVLPGSPQQGEQQQLLEQPLTIIIVVTVLIVPSSTTELAYGYQVTHIRKAVWL